MNRKYVIFSVKIFVVGILSVMATVSWFSNLIFLTLVMDSDQVLHFSPVASALVGILAMVFLCMSVRQGKKYIFFGLIFAAYFLLAMRSTNVNAVSGEINVYFAGNKINAISLSGLNDKPYCVDLDIAFVRVLVPGEENKFIFFRGVWPGYASSRMVEAAFGGFDSCTKK